MPTKYLTGRIWKPFGQIRGRAGDQRPLVVVGDFKAWTLEWDRRVTNKWGEIYLDLTAALELTLLDSGTKLRFTQYESNFILGVTFPNGEFISVHWVMVSEQAFASSVPGNHHRGDVHFRDVVERGSWLCGSHDTRAQINGTGQERLLNVLTCRAFNSHSVAREKLIDAVLRVAWPNRRWF